MFRIWGTVFLVKALALTPMNRFKLMSYESFLLSPHSSFMLFECKSKICLENSRNHCYLISVIYFKNLLSASYSYTLLHYVCKAASLTVKPLWLLANKIYEIQDTKKNKKQKQKEKHGFKVDQSSLLNIYFTKATITPQKESLRVSVSPTS